jgi:predicted CXXCH cytochrome family protein
MPKLRSDLGRRLLRSSIAVFGLLGSGLAATVSAQTASDIVNTKHNLSVSGLGVTRASTETRICVFCHTPHNAAPLSPLWNKELEPQAYTVYTSSTLRAGPLSQPSGPTKLCLSCHDGTIAIGAVLNPEGGITMAGGNTLPPGSLSNFGVDLSGHHPVSFPYHAALPNVELLPTPPSDLVYGGADEVHCTTCHDPHKDLYGEFLIKDNRYSALCTTCHQMQGWIGSAHATSTASVAGILPRPPKTWPTYSQLNEWGCEACHTPHFAPTPDQLLNFTAGPPPFSCTTAGCHSSQPGPPHGVAAVRSTGAPVDIGRQARKVSAHHEVPGQGAASLRGPGIAPGADTTSVGCADCHNPHVGSTQKSVAPYASGMLRGVRGVDRNGGLLRTATYEYEVCFRCHGDNAPDRDVVPRVVETTNTRLAFATENPSYHPVVGIGRTLNIPSIPSSFEPAMSPSQQIYCTACHADDEGGSNGPHGSSFAPILRRRYETADNTPESFDSYALCYRCHDRASILRDESFRKAAIRNTPSGGGHSGHLAAGVPCSACHDPHGVKESGAAGTGSHTHLVNFDSRIVLPKPGSPYPVFKDNGTFSGSCTLTCHGVAHDATSYP